MLKQHPIRSEQAQSKFIRGEVNKCLESNYMLKQLHLKALQGCKIMNEANLVKKTTRMSREEKQSLVQQVRQQNQAHFNEVFSTGGPGAQRHINQMLLETNAEGQPRNTIMDILTSQKSMHRQ